MGILNRLLNRGKVAQEVTPARTPFTWGMHYVPVDLRLTHEEMLTISTSFAAIREIVNPIASSEVRVFAIDSEGDRTLLPADPVAWLLNKRPCELLTAQAFKEIVIYQMIAYGNAYAEIVTDGAGRVKELWPLRSDRMRVAIDADGEALYEYTQADGGVVYLRSRQVLHFRGPCFTELVGGTSVLDKASKAIALGVAQERFATLYYQNGSNLGGVIKVAGTLTPEKRTQVQAIFDSLYKGNGRSHGVAVLSNDTTLERFTVDADKTQIVPSRMFSVEEIARFFGVPAVLLGVQAAAQGYGTNISQVYLMYTRSTLTPWVNRLAEELSYKLFPQRAPEREIEFDLTWLTQGDELQRAQANETNLRTGVITLNEARKSENRNGFGPEGDIPTPLKKPPEPANEPMAEDPAQEDPQDPPNQEAPANQEPDADHEALMSEVTAALERHSKRITARKADLQNASHTPEAIAQNVATLHPKAAAELAAFFRIAKLEIGPAAISAACASVEHVTPAKAAQHLLSEAR